MKPGWYLGLFCLLSGLVLTGCASPEKARYFNGVSEGNYRNVNKDFVATINTGDILSITVSSLNPEASAPFNSTINAIPVTNNPDVVSQLTGYLVDIEGNIDFPILGKFHAAGFPKAALIDSIKYKILEKKLLIDPIITVRILNFRVTVLGEVGRPGVVPVPSERISILEAIGFAGDMTLYAHRDNVLVIRYEDERKIVKRINLNSDDILSSPYYFLKANDIVYVESNNAKVQSTSRLNQLLPTILSGLAFAAVIFDRYTR